MGIRLPTRIFAGIHDCPCFYTFYYYDPHHTVPPVRVAYVPIDYKISFYLLKWYLAMVEHIFVPKLLSRWVYRLLHIVPLFIHSETYPLLRIIDFGVPRA